MGSWSSVGSGTHPSAAAEELAASLAFPLRVECVDVDAGAGAGSGSGAVLFSARRALERGNVSERAVCRTADVIVAPKDLDLCVGIGGPEPGTAG